MNNSTSCKDVRTREPRALTDAEIEQVSGGWLQAAPTFGQVFAVFATSVAAGWNFARNYFESRFCRF